MKVNVNGDDRIAELERQVRELTERVEGQPIVRPFPPKAAMCRSCTLAVQRSGYAVCGCIAFGPTITAAVA
jgi:hypothetical protein